MKAILIDSDILIEVTRGRNSAVLAHWDRLSASETPLFCSPVTIAELWHGAFPAEHAILNRLFTAIEAIPIDAAVGRRAGEYLSHFRKSHRMELGDALIGATASVHSLQLWTRHRRHYPMPDVSFSRNRQDLSCF